MLPIEKKQFEDQIKKIMTDGPGTYEVYKLICEMDRGDVFVDYYGTEKEAIDAGDYAWARTTDKEKKTRKQWIEHGKQEIPEDLDDFDAEAFEWIEDFLTYHRYEFFKGEHQGDLVISCPNFYRHAVIDEKGNLTSNRLEDEGMEWEEIKKITDHHLTNKELHDLMESSRQLSDWVEEIEEL